MMDIEHFTLLVVDDEPLIRESLFEIQSKTNQNSKVQDLILYDTLCTKYIVRRYDY